MIMEWDEYVKEELKYYDDHPEEDDPNLEAHTNDYASVEICYMD
tara:strand:+ start:1070 stop:1201 length:132 start_codon:yes stop_codon:yes gene_type:complete